MADLFPRLLHHSHPVLLKEDRDERPPKRSYSPPRIMRPAKLGGVVLSPSPGTFESGPGNGYKS